MNNQQHTAKQGQNASPTPSLTDADVARALALLGELAQAFDNGPELRADWLKDFIQVPAGSYSAALAQMPAATAKAIAGAFAQVRQMLLAAKSGRR